MTHSYTTLFGAWTRSSSHMFNSVMEANRAAFSVIGLDTDEDGEESGTGAPIEKCIQPAVDLPEWEVDLEATDGTLSVGDCVRFSKTLADEDVTRFAAASGDTNPVHLDDEWASETRFDGRIVHGTLAAGLISAALARLPGGVIYLSQDVEFQAPVRIGDRITADCEIVEDLGGGRLRLRTTVAKDDQQVIDGEAVVLIDDVPDHEAAD